MIQFSFYHLLITLWSDNAVTVYCGKSIFGRRFDFSFHYPMWVMRFRNS